MTTDRRTVLGAAAAATALAATAALLGAAPAGAATAAAQQQPGDTPRLQVLTYNTFLFSKTLYPNWGQDHRARTIPEADFFQGKDVVVLQEAFDNSSSDALKQHAADSYPYQTPVVGRSKSGWDATEGAYSGTTPEDGGVTLLSKWPIVHREQYVYADACGSDKFSNKGFVYAVLDVNGTRVHVVGTHTQATDSACAEGENGGGRATRAKQFKAIDAFLDAKHIPADEQVMVAGDLNVDRYGDEYASMLSDAGVVPADARTGHPHSFDTRENSIAADRYPQAPSEDLDHVLHRSGHVRPDSWTNHVVKEQTEPWTVSSWGKEYTYDNLSDHYPVTAG
ncbi:MULTISPECIES: sphingomyelin phosphodiesterase [unclassified Streptomyces]|uniref:sphingomyelin phosphodiesterase n=1 Tax=unclassified Streptomyces TaxID=2593676 RepID=UPI000C173D47|nr:MULTISPECIES: sphingomyelin phosphodiesterase [unclassified Streptomyces]MBQ0867663.1 sphingomyelin phosphodiesterase [Streptomyces sp. RK75]MBQ1119496.1 sphingomyelin phosphodiesterase [Streptomyces sp. B15]